MEANNEGTVFYTANERCKGIFGFFGLKKKIVKKIHWSYTDESLTDRTDSFIPNIWGRLAIPSLYAEASKRKDVPTNCKNCGAPLKLDNCVYCNTVY